MSDPLPNRVFEDTCAVLLQSGRLHVLVYADRLSGWPVIHRWMRDPTATPPLQICRSKLFWKYLNINVMFFNCFVKYIFSFT
jgi:hypothetical protein